MATMIALKSPAEIAAMRRSCQVAARALQAVVDGVVPGVTTRDLDRIAEDQVRALGGVPSFLGYRGFPASLCASVEDEVVHGIPGRRRLREGEIVSLDLDHVFLGHPHSLGLRHPQATIIPTPRREV